MHTLEKWGFLYRLPEYVRKQEETGQGNTLSFLKSIDTSWTLWGVIPKPQLWSLPSKLISLIWRIHNRDRPIGRFPVFFEWILLSRAR